MFEFWLFALLWTSDPLAIQRSEQDGAKPLATCVRPAVMVIEPNTVCALAKSASDDPQAISHWLRRWEHATRNNPRWTRSQREEFRRRMHEEFNEHSVAAVEQLIGRVQEKSLVENFEWRIIEPKSDSICLEAVPRDETERLFYASLRISLVTENGSPEQLVVVSRNRRLRTVWQTEFQTSHEQIQLVHFENGVPPAPKTFVKTANLSVD